MGRPKKAFPTGHFRVSMSDSVSFNNLLLAKVNKVYAGLNEYNQKFPGQINEALSISGKQPRIYGNRSLMAQPGIKDRYQKRLRDNGLLGYSRYGDKYRYAQADVDRILSQCHYAQFGC